MTSRGQCKLRSQLRNSDPSSECPRSAYLLPAPPWIHWASLSCFSQAQSGRSLAARATYTSHPWRLGAIRPVSRGAATRYGSVYSTCMVRYRPPSYQEQPWAPQLSAFNASMDATRRTTVAIALGSLNSPDAPPHDRHVKRGQRPEIHHRQHGRPLTRRCQRHRGAKPRLPSDAFHGLSLMTWPRRVFDQIK